MSQKCLSLPESREVEGGKLDVTENENKRGVETEYDDGSEVG